MRILVIEPFSASLALGLVYDVAARKGGENQMRWKRLIVMFAYVVVLVLGVAVGYALKPSVDVRVRGPAQVEGVAPMFDPNNPAYERLEAVIGPFFHEIVADLKDWQPVGTIGPFVVHVNPKTGGYLIGEDNARRTALMQETTDGETRLTLLGRCQEVSLTLTYDESTGKPVRTVFQANSEGGLLAPTKWVYMDEDGDGRFDAMVDCEAGVAYEQRGLVWIETGRRQEEEVGPAE